MNIRAIVVLAALFAPALGNGYELLFDADSPYHHVRVTEDEDVGYRFLSFDETRGTQSAMKIDDPVFLYYVYARLAFAGLAFVDEPNDVLFVGLGGASMPKFFRHHYPEANVDIAEIDPVIVEVAQKYFQYKPDAKTKIYVKDGRIVLSKIKKKYDLIFLDAYNTRSIPFHLTTKEFMQIVRGCLKPNGAVVSNIWSPDLNQYFEAEIKTFQETFPELYIFKALVSGNYIFIATNQAGQMPEYKLADRAARIQRDRQFHFDLADLIKSTYQYATNRPTREPALTDDRAPVNVMRWREVERAEDETTTATR